MEEREWLQAAGIYGDAHRKFAQFLLTDGAVEIDQACQKFLQFLIEPRSLAVPDLNAEQRKRLCDQLVVTMNKELETIAFRLVTAEDDYDGYTDWLVLTSQRQFSEMLAGTAEMSPDELALLKLWIREMMAENAGVIDQIRALNLEQQLPNPIGKKKVQEFMTQMIERNWLVEDVDGNLRLHQRALVELQPFLQREFSPPPCAVCLKFVVHQIRHVTCGVCHCKTHRSCLIKLLKSTNSGMVKCPGKLDDGQRCTLEYNRDDERLLAIPSAATANKRAKEEKNRTVNGHADFDD